MGPADLDDRLQESLIALPFGQRREMLQQHFEKLEVPRAGFFIWVEVGIGKIGLWIGCYLMLPIFLCPSVSGYSASGSARGFPVVFKVALSRI